ncbi:EI24 domain-containing protein [Planctomycetota bacterium]|nr:EI24 domain-containing protein [Planctomycetota bacterium]
MTQPALPIPDKIPEGWQGARIGMSAFWKGMKLVGPGSGMFSLVLAPVIASAVIIATFIIIAFIVGQGLIADLIQSQGWADWIAWAGNIIALIVAGMLGYFLFTPTMSLFRPLFLDKIAERVYQKYTGQLIHGGNPGNFLKRQLYAVVDVFKGIVVSLFIQMPLGIFALVTGAGALLTVPVHSYIEGRDFMAVPLDLKNPEKQIRAAWNKRYRWASSGLGGGAAVALLVPLLNLFVVPAGVAGATILMIAWERQDTELASNSPETASADSGTHGGLTN